MVKVNNLPENFKNYRWVVVRECGGYWFWGAYNDIDEMRKHKFEIGGESFLTSEVEP